MKVKSNKRERASQLYQKNRRSPGNVKGEKDNPDKHNKKDTENSIYDIMQKMENVANPYTPVTEETFEAVDSGTEFMKAVNEMEEKYRKFDEEKVVEDPTPKRRIMDFDNHSAYYDGTGQLQQQFGDLAEKLVPDMGKADTVEGELLRAVAKILYRHGNDGDNFSNASYEWIEKHVGAFDNLDEMATKTVQYVLDKKGEYTPNKFDWLTVADYGPGEYEQDWEQTGCNNCGGSGEIEYENDDGEAEYEECDSCDGNGWIEQTSESVTDKILNGPAVPESVTDKILNGPAVPQLEESDVLNKFYRMGYDNGYDTGTKDHIDFSKMSKKEANLFNLGFQAGNSDAEADDAEIRTRLANGETDLPEPEPRIMVNVPPKEAPKESIDDELDSDDFNDAMGQLLKNAGYDHLDIEQGANDHHVPTEPTQDEIDAYLASKKKQIGKATTKRLQKLSRNDRLKNFLDSEDDPYDISEDSQKNTQTGNDTMSENSILKGVYRVYEGMKMKNKDEFDNIARTGDYYITSAGHKVTKTKSGVKHDRTYKDDAEAVDEGMKMKNKDEFDNIGVTGDYYITSAGHKVTKTKSGVKHDRTYKDDEKDVDESIVRESDDVRNHPIYTDKEAWDHYKKETTTGNDEAVDINDELNEIAKLAGLPDEEVTVGGNQVKGLRNDWIMKKKNDYHFEEGFDPDQFNGKVTVPGPGGLPTDITYTAEIDHEQNRVRVTDCSNNQYQDECQADAEAEFDARDVDMPLDEERMDEGPTRKDFQMVADLLKDNPDMDDRRAKAQDYAEKFKAMNPRFNKALFLKAAGIGESIEEEAVDEGNEFTKARLDAIKAGKDSFEVDGKTYSVSGDTDKAQMNEEVNIQLSLDDDEQALELMKKLSGLANVDMPYDPDPVAKKDMSPVGSHNPCGCVDAGPDCGCDESDELEEERDIELANTPNEKVAPVTAVTKDFSGGLNGPKKMYPKVANPHENPIGGMNEAKAEELWSAYESMVKEVKKSIK